MTVIILLLSVSLLIAAGFLIAFLCSVKQGQLEDGEASSMRILFDDKPKLFKDK
jgi:cbb3-type cytochrome oxidase maturation protein